MRSAIISLLLLTACFTEDDARKKLLKMGRPDPIQCNYLDSWGSTFACHDGAGQNWICSESLGCTPWSSR